MRYKSVVLFETYLFLQQENFKKTEEDRALTGSEATNECSTGLPPMNTSARFIRPAIFSYQLLARSYVR